MALSPTVAVTSARILQPKGTKRTRPAPCRTPFSNTSKTGRPSTFPPAQLPRRSTIPSRTFHGAPGRLWNALGSTCCPHCCNPRTQNSAALCQCTSYQDAECARPRPALQLMEQGTRTSMAARTGACTLASGSANSAKQGGWAVTWAHVAGSEQQQLRE